MGASCSTPPSTHSPRSPPSSRASKSGGKRIAEREVKSADGKRHRVNELALAEARDPQEQGNKDATEMVVKLAEQMANAALVAMRDPRRAIASLLTSQDGEFAVGKDPSVHKATAGANVTNDRVESNLGCVDMLMRMFRYATVVRVSVRSGV